MILDRARPLGKLQNLGKVRHPRTAIGLGRDGRRLLLVGPAEGFLEDTLLVIAIALGIPLDRNGPQTGLFGGRFNPIHQMPGLNT